MEPVALRLDFVRLSGKKELPPLRNSGLNLALSKWAIYLGMRCNRTGIRPRHACVIVRSLAEGLDRPSTQLDVGCCCTRLVESPHSWVFAHTCRSCYSWMWRKIHEYSEKSTGGVGQYYGKKGWRTTERNEIIA